MSKKSQNSKLLLVLIVLLGVFLIANFLKGDKRSTNIRTTLVEVDTSLVQSIYLKPAQNVEGMTFERSGSEWNLNYSDKQFKTEGTAVQGLLSNVLTIKPKRLAGRSPEKWEGFQVTDSAGTSLILKDESGNELLNLVIGKFDYKPPPQGQGGINQGNNIQGVSFVRLQEEDDTYAVDGFLSLMFNQKPEQFRNQQFMALEMDNVRSISFTYPSDSSFTILKVNDIWSIDESICDSIEVANYLGQFTNKRNNKFEDNIKPSTNPGLSLIIAGDNMNQEFVHAWKNGENYILQTSQNEAYFKTSSPTEHKDIFRSARSFFTVTEN